MLLNWNIIFKEANVILQFQIHVVLFILCMGYFACVYICAPCECSVHMEVKEVVIYFGTGTTEGLKCRVSAEN